MHQPRFAPRLAEGALHRAMVGPGHLDRDDMIAEIVALARLAKLHGRQLQLGAAVLDEGGGISTWP